VTRSMRDRERGRIDTLARRRDFLRRRIEASTREGRPNHRDHAEWSALEWAVATLGWLIEHEQLAARAEREAQR